MLGRLHPVLRDYDWGSETFIPELLGIEPTGGPVAEAWFGAHPSGPSHLDTPQWSGPLDEVEPDLSYLVKFLAAARPLSIQAHPTAEQAIAGFATEESLGVPLDSRERIYRDPHSKPEAIVALEPFEMLYGFREPESTVEFMDSIGFRDPDGLRRSLAAGSLRDATEVVAGLDPDRRAAMIADVAAGCARLGSNSEHAAPAQWLAHLAQRHPDDIGVLFALLMNHHRLEHLEACFLPPRTLHAYLRGAGVEVMGNSDNVLRAGLTSKHVAVAELLEVVDHSPSAPEVIAPPVSPVSGWDVPVPTDAFALELLAGTQDLEPTGPEILLGATGSSEVTAEDHTVKVDAGRAAFLDGVGRAVLEVDGIVARVRQPVANS